MGGYQAACHESEGSSGSGSETDCSSEECSDSEAPATAKLQLANGVPVRPAQWGLTRQQLEDLLRRLRQDPTWKSSNNVYTLVQDYIVPWTRGTGMGYALHVNADAPKEVNVMISHAWCENAEEFLETLLRTCTDGDVPFVCALSLYQAEDGCGPSIAEQLGQGPHESPFRRVLENIRGHEEQAVVGGALLKFAARFSAFLAVCAYSLPAVLWGCVPSFTHCAMPELDQHGTVGWRWEAMGPRFPWFLGLAVVFGILTIVGRLLMKSKVIYRGRMVVVPNRECDLYERLWCVYEIFVAMTLGIRVRYAPTLAFAGRVQTKVAQCSSPADAERIRCEITRRHSFEEVDRVVFITTRAARWHAARVVVMYGTWLALFCTACVNVSGAPPTHPWWHLGFTFLASAAVVTVMYCICRSTQGVVKMSIVLTLGAVFVVLALALQVWGPSTPWLYSLASTAASVFSRAGLCTFLVLAGSKLCPSRPFVLGIVCATAALIVLIALYTPLSISLWLWVRSYPGISGSAYTLLMPSAFRSCTFSENPYPCGVRAGAFVAVNAVQVFIMAQASRRWGVRVV